MTYRPPGRSARSGRGHSENDVLEGLPVKQWGQSDSHVSLAPPKSEVVSKEDDKWGAPPMPRDYQLLNPWTQHLLRLARTGKVGTKRKQDPESLDDEKPDDEGGEESKANLDDRGFVAKKWKPKPESSWTPEHRHFKFLADRRKGLPRLYGPEPGAAIPMRKTKVQKAGPDGEIALYEVLVPEGQTVEGEVSETTELGEVKVVAAVPGTVIEGVGVANEEGVVVAEHLKPTNAPRRNRPPPKKKGGPGRGKKRVTFTNPDGSTYTTVVPNATKIVPQPGQTVTHVAKGEEAKADITAEQAAAHTSVNPNKSEGEGEGEDGEEGSDEEGDDDDDREEGEVSDDDTPHANGTPLPGEKSETNGTVPDSAPDSAPPENAEDVEMIDAALPVSIEEVPPTADPPRAHDGSSSPEVPLAKSSHSRQGSLVTPPDVPLELKDEAPAPIAEVMEPEPEIAEASEVIEEVTAPPEVPKFDDGDEDLLGGLEKSLNEQGEGESEAA